ncbi:unnamed protein product [Caenorhabditis angaria]|uniref:Uncharacterized protein n=1 Tax=Caenorhabditis angaria TaxID=860376 RepID=A0A9P1J2H6_9PELO|nr:unnamed protein product [Caenorhabditis angaria]
MSQSPPLKRTKFIPPSKDNDVEMTDADAPSTSTTNSVSGSVLASGNADFMLRFATYSNLGTPSLNNNMIFINGQSTNSVENNGNFEEIPNDPFHQDKK